MLEIIKFSVHLLILLIAISIAEVAYSEGQPIPEPSNPKKHTIMSSAADQKPISIKMLPSQQSKAEASKQEDYRKQKDKNDKWVAYSTVWLAGVTTVLAGFTAFLWWQTRKLVINAKETSKRELRAYVSIVGTGRIPNTVNPSLPAFQIQVKNTGQTPAYNVKSWRGIGIHELPLLTELKPMKGVSVTDTAMGSGCNSVHPVRRKNPFSPDQVKGLKAGTHALYIFGRIEYKDAFSDKHFTDFCLYEADGGPDAGLKRAPSGNNAD